MYISEYMIYIQKLGVTIQAMVFHGSTHWDVLAAVEMNSDYLCQLVLVCLLKKTQVKTGGEICAYRCVLVLAAQGCSMLRE